MVFKQLYKTYHKMVLNLALQYVQNLEDAEEITQDVFVKVYQHQLNFKKNASIKTWIYRTTINQSLDFIKSKQTQKRTFIYKLFRLDELKTTYEPSHFNHPGIILEQQETCKKIFRAINQLKNKQKTAIILLKLENKTQTETAAIMNISVKALESIIQRAKKKLSTLLNTP